MGFLGMVGYATRVVAGASCGWVLGIITLKYQFLGNEEKNLKPKEDVVNN